MQMDTNWKVLANRRNASIVLCAEAILLWRKKMPNSNAMHWDRPCGPCLQWLWPYICYSEEFYEFWNEFLKIELIIESLYNHALGKLNCSFQR